MKRAMRFRPELQQWIVAHGRARLWERPEEVVRADRRLRWCHYLAGSGVVGERLYYVAATLHGGWIAGLVSGAAAKGLRLRNQWTG